jgi:hypothetical protein
MNMFRALVIKELRESAGLMALAMIGLVLLCADLVGLDNFLTQDFLRVRDYFPFVTDQFTSRFVIVVVGLAIALGVKQSAWELWQNTYPFLLHRPAGRRMVFGTKLFVGCGLVFVFGGLAIFAYALLAAAPGNSPTPFFWSMTADEWQLVLCSIVVYLGAFLSGIRPARWYGTRFAPLATAGGAALLGYYLAWWFFVALALVVAAIYLAGIAHYQAERDY